MKKYLIIVITLVLGIGQDAVAQFKPPIVQSYLLYNKARLLEAENKMDSAAVCIAQSIKLNKYNLMTRSYAWDVFFKSARYHEALVDIKDYFQHNLMPDSIDYFFSDYDSATQAKAFKNKEVQEFISNYKFLKIENKKTLPFKNEFRDIVENCMAIDQFARTYALNNLEDSNNKELFNKIIKNSDSSNIETLVDYLKAHPLPASTEGEVTGGNHFTLLLWHTIRDTNYSHIPAWKYLDSVVLEAVYTGKFPLRNYIDILDERHIIETHKQLFGTLTTRATIIEKDGGMRKYYPEIDDIKNVDKRRKEWLQPSLYEEYLIQNKKLVLPKEYSPAH